MKMNSNKSKKRDVSSLTLLPSTEGPRHQRLGTSTPIGKQRETAPMNWEKHRPVHEITKSTTPLDFNNSFLQLFTMLAEKEKMEQSK